MTRCSAASAGSRCPAPAFRPCSAVTAAPGERRASSAFIRRDGATSLYTMTVRARAIAWCCEASHAPVVRRKNGRHPFSDVNVSRPPSFMIASSSPAIRRSAIGTMAGLTSRARRKSSYSRCCRISSTMCG